MTAWEREYVSQMWPGLTRVISACASMSDLRDVLQSLLALAFDVVKWEELGRVVVVMRPL